MLRVSLLLGMVHASVAGTTFYFNTSSNPGWTTVPDYRWERYVGKAFRRDTSDTGPGDGSGYYMLAMAAFKQQGDILTLKYDGSVCTSQDLSIVEVAFRFHMYGDSVSTLRLVSEAGLAVWSLGGNQGDAWHTASGTPYSRSFRFEYVVGHHSDDAAITNVTVTCGVAPPSPPLLPPSPPEPPPTPPSQPPSPPPPSRQSVHCA